MTLKRPLQTLRLPASTPMWQRIAASAGLLVSSPVLAAAAILIRMSDGGPVLYRAPRAGVEARPFTMYKLRTMRLNADSQGSITASEDSRVFPVGRLLRRFKLDELPQLMNVINGDMALVGPRPEAIDIVENHYEQWMMETLSVPPGITGPGSLHYIKQEQDLPPDPDAALRVYVATLLPRKLAYELVYVRSRSLRYELQLIRRTLLRVLDRHAIESPHDSRENLEALKILKEVSRWQPS